MQTQVRDAHKIYTDAIHVGIKKARMNCLTCAESYFNIAQEHGASEQDILFALQEATHTHGQHMSRRSMLQLLIATAGALGTAGLIAQQAYASPNDQNGDYFGTDSNTQSHYGIQQDFYIGRMGQALTPDSPSFAFNNAAAQVAGLTKTYGYWAVHGPNTGSQYRPSGLSDMQWGMQQADMAMAARAITDPQQVQYAGLIGGQTIFAEIESNTSGWDVNNFGPNMDVLNGFLNQIYAHTPVSIYPGLYITPSNWNSFFGTDALSNTPFVLWIASYNACSQLVCPPCVNCGSDAQQTQPTVHALFQSTVKNLTVGGNNPVIWQFWVGVPGDALCGVCPNDDYNLTTQDPSTGSFQPSADVVTH